MEQQHNGKRGAPNNNHTLKRAKAIPIPKCYQLNLSNHTELQDELKKISNVITSTQAATKAINCFGTFVLKFKILLERTCNSEKVEEILTSLTTKTTTPLNEHISFIRHLHNSLSKLLYLCDIDDNNLLVIKNEESVVSSISDDSDDSIRLTVNGNSEIPLEKYSDDFNLNKLNKLYRQTNAHRNIKYDSIVIKVYIHDIKIHYFLTSKYLSDLFIATMYKGCGDNWPFLTYDMYRYYKESTTPDLEIYDSTNDSTIEITPIIDARFMNDNEPWIINIHSGNIVYTNKGIITLKIVYDMLIIIEMIRLDNDLKFIEEFSEIKIELVNGLNGWYLQLEYNSNIYKNGEDYQKDRPPDKSFPKKIKNLNLVFKVYDQALTKETRLHMIYIKILLSIFGHDYNKSNTLSKIDTDSRKWLINILYNMLLNNSEINNMYSISDKYTSGLVLPTSGKTTIVVYYSKQFESSSIPKEYDYYHVNLKSYKNEHIAKIKYKTSTPENLFGLGINKSLMMYSSATINQFLSFHCELPTYEHIKTRPMLMNYRGHNPIIVSGENVQTLYLNINPLWSNSFFSKKKKHVIPFFIPCFGMIKPMAFKPNTINDEINKIKSFFKDYDFKDYDITPDKLNKMKGGIEYDYEYNYIFEKLEPTFLENHYLKVKLYIFSNILCKCINYFKDIFKDKENVLIANLIFAVIDQNSSKNKQLLDEHMDVALCINEHLDDVFNTYKELNVDFKCIFQPGSPLDINNYLVKVDFFRNNYTSSLSTRAVELEPEKKDEYFKSFKTGYITFLIDRNINKGIIDTYDKNVTLFNNTGTRLTFNIKEEGRTRSKKSDNNKLEKLLGINSPSGNGGYKLEPENPAGLYKTILSKINDAEIINTEETGDMAKRQRLLTQANVGVANSDTKTVPYSLYKRHDNLYDEKAKVVVGTFDNYGMFNGHVIFEENNYWGVLYEDSDIEIKEEEEMNLPTGDFHIISSNWWKEMLDKIKDIIRIIYFRTNFSEIDFCKLIEELNIYEELLEIYVKKIKDFILIIGIDPDKAVKKNVIYRKEFIKKLKKIREEAMARFNKEFGNELDGKISDIYGCMRDNVAIPEVDNTQISNLAKKTVDNQIYHTYNSDDYISDSYGFINNSYDILSELYPANSYIDEGIEGIVDIDRIDDYKTIYYGNLKFIIPIEGKTLFTGGVLQKKVKNSKNMSKKKSNNLGTGKRTLKTVK